LRYAARVISMDSPCIDECEIDGGFCEGCGRSVQQIATWRNLTEERRQKIMEKL